jgi:hypothetical protein
MSQYTAPGGAIIDSGDKRVTRKVVVSTGGENPQPPGGPGRLTNSSITSEPGGIRRGVFEYTEGGEGGANYNVYGKKTELLGGSREVPIYKHPNFKTLSDEEIATVQQDVENKTKSSGYTTAQNNLYQCLIRKIEYYLAPSLIARVSEIESSLPSVAGLCKIDEPAGVVRGDPEDSIWLLTAISAIPVGDKYEVAREYTMASEPEAALFLYE